MLMLRQGGGDLGNIEHGLHLHCLSPRIVVRVPFERVRHEILLLVPGLEGVDEADA